MNVYLLQIMFIFDNIEYHFENVYSNFGIWLYNDKSTKYIIKYVERKKDYKINDKEIYSIISKKSGIVKDIYTYSGISQVDIDNYVSKGDVLISSDIILNEEVRISFEFLWIIYSSLYSFL